jgi:hypothetical protein
VQKRLLGADSEHPGTMANATNLASSLSRQGKHADAERIQREVLGAQKRVLGAKHPDTLTCASNLAMSLSNQGKYADAERIQREVTVTGPVHEVLRRVRGAEHPGTLTTGHQQSGWVPRRPRQVRRG